MDASILAQLSQIPNFTNLSDDEFKMLADMIEVKHFEPDQTVIVEGRIDPSLYILMQGSVNLVKQSGNKQGDVECIGTVDAIAKIGEISFLNNVPRTCSVVTTQQSMFYILDRAKFLPENQSYLNLLNKLIESLTFDLSQRLGNMNTGYIEKLENEKKLLQQQVELSNFTILLLVAFATGFIINRVLIEYLSEIPLSSRIFNWTYLILLIIPTILFLSKHTYLIPKIGLNLKDFKRTLLQSLTVIAVVNIIAISILLCINTFHRSNNSTTTQILSPYFDPNSFTLIYLCHSFFQELINRGVVLTVLEQYLGAWKAILLSALVFSLFHSHFSLIVMGLMFLSGILLGYVFTKQRNLLGVTLIHFVVGTQCLSAIHFYLNR